MGPTDHGATSSQKLKPSESTKSNMKGGGVAGRGKSGGLEGKRRRDPLCKISTMGPEIGGGYPCHRGGESSPPWA